MKRFLLFAVLFTLAFSVAAQDETLYTNRRGVRMRDEAATSAPLVTTLARGVAVTVIFTEDGSRVSGSTLWYYVTAGDYEGYIHSSLLTNIAPAASGSSGSSAPVQNVQSTPVPDSPPVDSSTCPSFDYTCSQLTCDQAYACLAAGYQRLDRDNDGKPCEQQCGG